MKQELTVYTYGNPWVKVEVKPDSLSTPIWAWCLIFFVTGFCVALVEIVAC